MYLRGARRKCGMVPSFGEVGKEVLLVFDRVIPLSSVKIRWLAHLPFSTEIHLTVKVPPVFPSRPVTGSLQIVRSFYHDPRRLASLFVRSGQDFSLGRLGLSDVRPRSVILQDPGWGSCSGSHKGKGGPGPFGPGPSFLLMYTGGLGCERD